MESGKKATIEVRKKIKSKLGIKSAVQSGKESTGKPRKKQPRTDRKVENM